MHPSAHSLSLALLTLALLAMCAPSAVASAGVADTPVYQPDPGIWRFPKPGPPPLAAGGTDAPAGGTDDAAGWRDWTFAPNMCVHPPESGEHIWPDIAVAEDGTVGIAWMDNHAAGGYHIFYTFSSDGSATWAPVERVDDRASGSYSKFVTLAFTPAGAAIAVWEDDRSGQINLYFSKRTGTPGTPWTPNLRINTAGSPPSGADFMNPSLAVLDEERFFVAWTDWREGVFHQVYCRGTRDGGATWGVERRISDGLGYQPVAGDPCLIVDPTVLYPGAEVLYCVTNDWRGDVPGGRYPNVYFYRSFDGGLTWSVGVMVNDVESLYQQTSSHAMVRLEDGALAAGWLNNSDLTLSHFCVSRSTDQGATWLPSVQVDEPSGGGTGTYSAIATDGAYLYAAYDQYATSWDAHFRASPNGGADWPEASVRIDDDATGAATGNPVLAAPRASIVPQPRSMEVYAAWQDNRAPGYNWKIFATRGSLAGQGVPEAATFVSRADLRVCPNPSPAGTAVMLSAVAATMSGGRARPSALAAAGASGTPARVGIFDAAGRAIRWLDLAAGGTVWDGRDAFGRVVPAGRFWIRAAGAPGLSPASGGPSADPSASVPVVRLR